MDLPRIEVDATPATIGIQQQRPSITISQQQADMQIDQEVIGTFEISTTASELFINQAEAFADANSTQSLRWSKEMAANSQQNVLQYVAKVNRQGDQLRKIEHGTDAIPAIAKENGERREKQFNVAMMPESSSKVQINYRPSQLSIDAAWPETNISIQQNKPQVMIPRWQTDVYLQQKNQLNFSVVGGTVNQHI